VPQNTLSRVTVAGPASLTTSKVILPIVQDLVLEPLSLPLPDWCRLHKIEVQLTTIAGGAANILWNLAKDALGNYPYTPETTSAIVAGATSAAIGGFAAILDTDRVPITTQFVSGTVYLVARIQTAGTATLTKALLYWVP
jgi:hypothetical protein